MDTKSLKATRSQFHRNSKGNFRICTYVVDQDRKIRRLQNTPGVLIPEAELHGYISLARNGLSGKVGKTLHPLGFGNEKTTGQGWLKLLRENGLQDEESPEALCKLIADNFSHDGAYLVMFIYGSTELMSIDDNGLHGDRYDFDYVMTCICPINQVNSRLYFIPDENHIQSIYGCRKVVAPHYAFFYPLLENMAPNPDAVLFYSWRQNSLDPGLIRDVLGCTVPVDAPTQKREMARIIPVAPGRDCTFEKLCNIYKSIKKAALGHGMEEALTMEGKKDMVATNKVLIHGTGIDIIAKSNQLYRINIVWKDGKRWLVVELDS